MDLPEEARRDVLARLSRIEGQVRGVRRMIEQERGCMDVVRQLAAMRAALGKVAAAVIAENLEECVRRSATEGGDAELRQAKQALLEFV